MCLFFENFSINIIFHRRGFNSHCYLSLHSLSLSLSPSLHSFLLRIFGWIVMKYFCVYIHMQALLSLLLYRLGMWKVTAPISHWAGAMVTHVCKGDSRTWRAFALPYRFGERWSKIYVHYIMWLKCCRLPIQQYEIKKNQIWQKAYSASGGRGRKDNICLQLRLYNINERQIRCTSCVYFSSSFLQCYLEPILYSFIRQQNLHIIK